jgi:hypothetical protein
MQKAIAELIEKKSAYLGSDGSIYFDATSFESYGAISGNRLEALKPGHRYEYKDEGGKRFHADWALWKLAGARTQMIWESPWGAGFPGWHIECSAMSIDFLTTKMNEHNQIHSLGTKWLKLGYMESTFSLKVERCLRAPEMLYFLAISLSAGLIHSRLDSHFLRIAIAHRWISPGHRLRLHTPRFVVGES